METHPDTPDAASVADSQSAKTYRIRVDSAGRIVLPAELRGALSLRGGDAVLLRQERGGLRIESFPQALVDAQIFFTRHGGSDPEGRVQVRPR